MGHLMGVLKDRGMKMQMQLTFDKVDLWILTANTHCCTVRSL